MVRYLLLDFIFGCIHTVLAIFFKSRIHCPSQGVPKFLVLQSLNRQAILYQMKRRNRPCNMRRRALIEVTSLRTHNNQSPFSTPDPDKAKIEIATIALAAKDTSRNLVTSRRPALVLACRCIL